MYLHLNIKYLRKINNLSQTQLGEHLGITNSQVGLYEKGKSEPPVSKIIQMTDIFKVSLQDIVFTDLSNAKAELIESYTPSKDKDEGKMIEELNDLLRKRVLQLEEILKENDPEQAKRWGIE